jgi:hypothetical protein
VIGPIVTLSMHTFHNFRHAGPDCRWFASRQLPRDCIGGNQSETTVNISERDGCRVDLRFFDAVARRLASETQGPSEGAEL